MEVTVICAYCGKPTRSPQTCRFCGATVCEECYFFEKGICKKCAQGKK